MRIELTSIYVDDQRAALAFYTDVLGSAQVTKDESTVRRWCRSWEKEVRPDEPRGPQAATAQARVRQPA